MSRFDYVKYDDKAQAEQAEFKALFEEIELKITRNGSSDRSRSLALTNLEQAYMWIGKVIRDDQVARGGDAADQPARG